MNDEFQTSIKKIVLSSLSVLMLAGSVLPMHAFAEGTEDVSVEESIADEMQEEEAISDDLSEEVLDENEENAEADNTTYSLIDFVDRFEALPDASRRAHIDMYDLYADDERTLHSGSEEVDLTFLDYNDKDTSALIDYLIDLRNENISLLEQDSSLLNKDLIEEGVDLNVETSPQPSEFNMASVSPSSNMSLSRLEGQNRYETAVQISRSGWSRANTVIIVDANGFADALAGAPLAASLDAPILLAGNHNGVQATYREIERLGATKAIILGGEVAVSKAVENEIARRNVSVERIAGANRYETAGLISQRVISRTNSRQAILVSGEDFADAMSVAPFAAKNGMPIYLTRRRTLAEEVKTASNTIKDWTIIGGGSAITGTVGRELQGRISSIRRIEGSDRYQTNQRVINHFGTTGNRAYVATGITHADALTGSVLAAKHSTAVILTRGNDTVLQSTINYVNGRNYTRLTLFGGTVALSSDIAFALTQLRLPSDKPLVYIDPGHGGTDSGASYAGIHEKNLVLPTSRYLRDMLLATGNYEVVMSRNADVTKPMSERSGEANRLKADILVSVHNNAMGGVNAGRARGIETFIYHPTYTTARSHFNTGNGRIRESLRLADAIHPIVVSRTPLSDRGVRGANLHMVREPNMPAIIIELGFLDNPTDRSIITTDSFMRTSAQAMKDGIDLYFGN